MSFIKLKIDGNTFNTVLRDEMLQEVKYCDKKYNFFEYILISRVGRIEWYKNWYEIDGFYYCEVKFCSSMVLNKLKKLTLDHEIMRGCRVDILMTTCDKYGYYQVENGFTDVGFSIKNEKIYYEKLVSDVKRTSEFGSVFKLNLKEIVVNKYDERYDLGEKYERNVYSFFVNKDGYEMERLNSSIENLSTIY